MNVESIRKFLLSCLVINVGILLLWLGAITLAGDEIYALHSGMFRDLSRESFDAIHYAGIAAYKMAVGLFNGVPLVALWRMSRSPSCGSVEAQLTS